MTVESDTCCTPPPPVTKTITKAPAQVRFSQSYKKRPAISALNFLVPSNLKRAQLKDLVKKASIEYKELAEGKPAKIQKAPAPKERKTKSSLAPTPTPKPKAKPKAKAPPKAANEAECKKADDESSQSPPPSPKSDTSSGSKPRRSPTREPWTNQVCTPVWQDETTLI